MREVPVRISSETKSNDQPLFSIPKPTKDRDNSIWPVRRPLEAAAVASRVRVGMGVKEAVFSCLPVV